MTPDGWRRSTLGGVVATEGGLQTGPFGAQLHASDYVSDGVPVVMPKDLAGGRIVTDSIARVPEHLAVALSRHRVVPGDILFGRRGDIGRCGLVLDNEHGWLCGTGCVRARLDLVQAWPQFLVYALTWGPTVQWLTDNAVGQTMLNLNTSILASLPLLLPPPGEQRKIAAILSAVDDAIESTQAVIVQLQVVKKAIMAELLARGLPGHHTRFKQAEIGEVPEEWTLCSIDDLNLPGEPAVRTGPFGSSMKTKDFRPSGIQVLTIQSLGEGKILHEGLYFVDAIKAEELADYRVRENDVVFSRVADIGRCVAISADEVGWLISPNLSRIRLDPDKADATFFMYLITLGAAVSRQVEMVAGNAGRPVISSATLKAIRLPIPSVSEQRAIAALGRELERRIGSEVEFLKGLRIAKSALMSVLLTGEVRVTPDKDAV